MTDRTYGVPGFVAAFVSFLTHKDLDDELGEYHRARYAALKAAFEVDLEAPPSKGAQQTLLWNLFHGAIRRYLAASTPFDGVHQAPGSVSQLLSGHRVRLARLRDGTRAELLSMASTIFVALHGDREPVHERDLLAHGFAGGDEPDRPDPWDLL